jgi:hypothetical protein
MPRDKRLISALAGYAADNRAKGKLKNSYIIPSQFY